MKMKRIVLVAMALCIAVCASAKGHFGVTAGINNAVFPLKSYDDHGMVAFSGGVVYNQPIFLGFAVQPELLFNTKGTNWEAYGYKDNFRVSYLELPVQIQWGLDLIAFRPYVFAEPFVGYALAGRYNDQSETFFSGDFSMSSMKSRFEYGIGVGGGIEVGTRLQLAAKYYWNLEGFDYKDATGSWLFGDVRERPGFCGFSVMLTFLF